MPEVPGYEVQDRLGAGGMGEVYRARCRPDGRVVAIKIEGQRASQDPRAHFRERFLREARILRELRHENLPQFYGVGEVPDGRVFIAMELLIGRTLSEFVGQDLETLIPLFIQCARALKVTSEAGVVHRDVSPDNFFVVEVGGRSVVKLIDFGISRDNAAIADGLTRAGTFLGKLRYCSPEQTGLLRDLKTVDWRTDLYSFALTMYAVLEHRLPFQGETSQAQFQERAREVDPQVFAGIPSERMRRLLAKMLRQRPDDRPGSFDEVVVELLHVKAEVAEEQANHLDASTRMKDRATPASAAAPAPGTPAPAPVRSVPSRVTPLQFVHPSPAPERSPAFSVSIETMALLSGVLILGSLALYWLGSASRPLTGLLLVAGLGLAALSVRRQRAGASGRRPSASVHASASKPAAPAAAAAQQPPAKETEVTVEAPGARLVIAGDGPNREVLLCGDQDGSWPAEILIGRGVKEGPAAVRISSRTVSAVQARLRHQAGTFSVENLSKTNTTRVNGRELSPGENRLLAVGDRIEMGPVIVSFHVR
jgi:serine/threonine protein kinase